MLTSSASEDLLTGRLVLGRESELQVEHAVGNRARDMREHVTLDGAEDGQAEHRHCCEVRWYV